MQAQSAAFNRATATVHPPPPSVSSRPASPQPNLSLSLQPGASGATAAGSATSLCSEATKITIDEDNISKLPSSDDEETIPYSAMGATKLVKRDKSPHSASVATKFTSLYKDVVLAREKKKKEKLQKAAQHKRDKATLL